MCKIIKISAESLNDFRKESAQFAHNSDLFGDESESQNDTPRRFAVVVTTNDRRPISQTYKTQTTAEIVYNKIKRLLIRLGYTLADSGGNDISKGICELWTKGSTSRNIEIYPTL